jgi:hypothetical protein
MKIEITGRAAGTTAQITMLLCTSTPAADSDPTGPLEGWSYSAPRTIQSSHPVRATYLTHYNRGGRAARLQFACFRKFASRRAAEDFCFRHERTLPQGGTVKITTDSDAGSQIITISNAEVAEPVFTNLGSLVQISYSIIGGATS